WSVRFFSHTSPVFAGKIFRQRVIYFSCSQPLCYPYHGCLKTNTTVTFGIYISFPSLTHARIIYPTFTVLYYPFYRPHTFGSCAVISVGKNSYILGYTSYKIVHFHISCFPLLGIVFINNMIGEFFY